MFRLFARLKKLFVVGLLIALPLVFLYWQKRVPTLRLATQGTMIDVAGFFQSRLVAFSGWFSDGFYKHMFAASQYDELLQLRRKIAERKLLESTVRELHDENQHLRELLQFEKVLSGAKPIYADVIGRSGTPLSRYVQINRGSKSGVERGDAVVSAAGAVGQVSAVGSHVSDVLLISDRSSAVDVLVQRTRSRGLIRGSTSNNRYMLRVEDFDRFGEVRTADVIITSGVGTKFPKGIPVGIVKAVQPKPDGMYIRAEVEPAADFSTLEHVLIVKGGSANMPVSLFDAVCLEINGNMTPLTESIHTP